MLVLMLERDGEAAVLTDAQGRETVVRVVSASHGKARLTFDAPKDIRITRRKRRVLAAPATPSKQDHAG